MSKHKNRGERRAVLGAPAPVVANVSREQARASEVRLIPQSNAGECLQCKAWRAAGKIQNRTVIYAKRGDVRYCKCLVCTATWKRTFVQAPL